MGNPHLKDARVHLDLADQTTRRTDEDAHTARAAIHAQLAIAYELNTLGRLLAKEHGIIARARTTDPDLHIQQHNAIVERLGL